MSNVKLKIERHKTNNNTISFFLDKKKYVKDSNHLHKILKEKLKDRYRIKGAFFSVPRNKQKIKYKTNKEGSSSLLNIEEANYLLSKNNYEKLKHDIYVKEKKDKEKKRKENVDKDLFKKDINYTSLKETIYQFLRFKNRSNLYRANIMKNKIELKLANKISKKNFINQTLKTVKLHFSQVKGKIDLGRKPMEETENEYAYKKLAEKIENSRLKYMNKLKNENEQISQNKDKSWYRKSFMFLNRSEKINKDINLIDILSNNLTEKNVSINLKNEKMEGKENSNNIDKNDYKIVKKNKRNYTTYYKTESNENNILSRNENLFGNINKLSKNSKRKKTKRNKHILSDKKLKIDINNINFNNIEIDNISPKLNSLKCDSNGNENCNSHLKINMDKTNLNKTLNNIRDNKDSLNDNSLVNKEMPYRMIDTINHIKNNENINNNMSNKTNTSSDNNRNFINDLKNIEKMKKNNLIVSMKKRNPIFWNNNMKRVQTAGFRAISNKVTNKPLYTTKIGDLVREFNRIKSVSKKSKIRMREKHLTTINEIDKIAGIKEDLLMFNLKIKYFNCAFPKKRQKIIPKNQIIKKKVANCMKIVDNPFNLDIDDESSNDNYD